MKKQSPRFAAHGFTLIELLVVMAVSAVLASLMMPAVQQAREAARRSQCNNNMKQVALAMHNYHDAHRVFPPGYVSINQSNNIGWGTLILPFMEQAPLYNKIKDQQGFHSDWNASADKVKLAQTELKLFTCPSDKQEVLNSKWPVETNTSLGKAYAGKSNYLVTRSIGDKNSRRRMRDITDGTSNTLMAGERETKIGYGGIWMGAHKFGKGKEDYTDLAIIADPTGSANGKPFSINSADTEDHKKNACSSTHQGGAHFILCDGRVRFISENIAIKVYRSLTTHNGGEILGQ